MIFVICKPVSEGPSAVRKSFRVGCFFCGAPCWIAPGTIRRIHPHPFVVGCNDCVDAMQANQMEPAFPTVFAACALAACGEPHDTLLDAIVRVAADADPCTPEDT